MVKKTFPPDKAELIYLDFDPSKGAEQKGKRPALVVTKKAFNKSVGRALMAPITTTEPKTGFQIKIPEGLQISGTIQVDQVAMMDWNARPFEKKGFLPRETFEKVQDILQAMIEG
jgi:mRNA interferase MazF